MPPHSYVPFGNSLCSTSFDEWFRPGMCYAYPLPQDHAADLRFRRLLDALGCRYGVTRGQEDPA